ncbi:hypothetical protein FOA52_009635 [Chlamydomonas sp. UWO 241]|nr:hypothetical protein FOA52_009635 [Chlamydomonas sp. UWO 241]
MGTCDTVTNLCVECLVDADFGNLQSYSCNTATNKPCVLWHCHHRCGDMVLAHLHGGCVCSVERCGLPA